MKRLSSLCATALVLCALALPVTAKDTWLSVRSKNFLLVGNASEKEIKGVATRLEQFRDVFLRLFPKAAPPAPLPTIVVVFKSDSSYRPFKPLYQGKIRDNIAGYFQPGEDVNYITLTTEARGTGDSPYHIIFHEYTHLLVDGVLRDPPVWFNEGLAEYYSTFEMSKGDKEFTLGKAIGDHVLRLREQFMPLEDLLRVTHDSPTYNERDKTGVFYAESWAFVHYLLQGDKGGARVAQLGRFNDLLATGHTLEESFQQAFQTDFATMEKAVRKYVQNSFYQDTIFTAEQPLTFDAQMQTAPLSDAEAQAYLGDLLLHGDRADEAEKYVQQALALAPELPLAHSVLGRVRYRQKRYDEASKSLQHAVALNPQDYLAHFYLAETLNRKALGPDNLITTYPAEIAAAMRAELKQAIALNENFSEAYHLLAFLDVVNEEELQDATTLLIRARQLKPARLQYAVTLAKVYLRRQQFDAARKVLGQVLRSSNADGEMRAEARTTLQQVDDYAQQLARVKALNAEAAATQAQQRQQQAQQERPRLEHRSSGESSAQPESPLTPADLRPLIKKRPEGAHVRGVLTKIECAGGQSVVFYVQATDRLYKFYADQFDRVELVAYVTDVGGTSITCGPVKKEMYVILTFRPAPQSRVKYDGEAVAVDLVTKDMDMEP